MANKKMTFEQAFSVFHNTGHMGGGGMHPMTKLGAQFASLTREAKQNGSEPPTSKSGKSKAQLDLEAAEFERRLILLPENFLTDVLLRENKGHTIEDLRHQDAHDIVGEFLYDFYEGNFNPYPGKSTDGTVDAPPWSWSLPHLLSFNDDPE